MRDHGPRMSLYATAWGDEEPGHRVHLEMPPCHYADSGSDTIRLLERCARETFRVMWGYEAVGVRHGVLDPEADA